MKPSEPMPALIETVCNTIRQSMETFASRQPSGKTETLSGQLVADVSAALQQSLLAGAREGLAGFIQAYESGQETVERDGLTYRSKGTDTKVFLTIFGEIVVPRRRYAHWNGGLSVVPLDEAWGMQGRYATPEVTGHVLLASSMLPAGEVSELLGRMCPFRPSASLVQDLVNEDASVLGRLLSLPEHAAEMRPSPALEEVPTALVASMDGANVLVREPGKKRGRPAERPGTDDARVQPSSYKNAMVGSISRYRRNEDVINIETGEDAKVPERILSTYLARMPEPGAPTFKAEFEREVERELRFLPRDITKVLLMDGARGLWNYAENAPLFSGFRMLVDFFHASEHLSDLAEALFGKSSDRANDWYEKWRHKLKYEKGAVDAILRSSARYAKAAALPKARREELAKQQTYFRRNRARMNYHEFVAEGLPIGSGPVEAACKTLVKARLCQSGMRWSVKGGQHVLNLRVLHKSGHWDAAWEHYQQAGGYHFTGYPTALLPLAA
jgi:hypothetical protein